MMKKRILSLFFCVIMLFVVAACATDLPDDSIDQIAPVLTLGNIPTEVNEGTAIAINFTVTDNVSEREKIAIVVVVLNEDGDDITEDVYSPETGLLVPPASGLYVVRVTATDEAGKSATKQAIITVLEEEVPMQGFVLPAAPDYGNNVSVHDPSIFRDDDGKYYTFGSHFDVATSTDLMKWTQWNSGSNTTKAARLYGSSPTWQTILADAFAHVGRDNSNNPPSSTWAPDVIKLNNKYYMYYSLSLFGSGKSYIGRVEADSVTGPYSNSVEVIKTPGDSAFPNAIDAAFFRDKNDKLWMTYGSFFGGIYIFEMETSGARVGLPKAGQGTYGTRIWSGSIANGPEGPYVFYNPDTDYYYLMVSHGSLSSDYNMRVARSRNPEGPYTDIRNLDVSTINSGGNKLAGNYKFEGASRGYAALGHNSVLVEDGKYYVIYHTRYLSGTSGVSGNHNQYVNQLFFNKDGWPVLAPNRYAGEEAGKVTSADLVGDYDLIIHTVVGNSADFMHSQVYTFDSDGSIKQGSAVKGSWSLVDDYYVLATVNGSTYSSVAVPQYNNDLGYAELSITGVSSEGVSMWANKKPAA